MDYIINCLDFIGYNLPNRKYSYNWFIINAFLFKFIKEDD